MGGRGVEGSRFKGEWQRKYKILIYYILQMSEIHHGHPLARGHNKWRALDKNWAGKDQHPDKKAKVGLDWAHPQENKLQCHQAGTGMEPTEEEEPRPSQKQLEEDGRWRGEQSRLHLVAAWKDSPKQNTMASSGFRGPVLHWERKGISQVSQYTICPFYLP